MASPLQQKRKPFVDSRDPGGREGGRGPVLSCWGRTSLLYLLEEVSLEPEGPDFPSDNPSPELSQRSTA